MSALKDVRARCAHRSLSLTLSLVAAAALLAACGKKPEGAAGAAPGGGMPPPQVGVVTVTPTTVSLTTELPGRLEASRVAQVRARAAGILRERVFKEGSDVKAGQLLFRIDSAPYQAALASAQATLARAQANVAQTTAQAERFKPLMEANAISKQDYINAVSAQKSAEADLAASRAAVQTAQINLGYASVTSPIAGRIGRALVTEGALVGQGEATPLAVVQQINPMYVNFTQSTTEVLKLRQALAAGKLQKAGADAARVQVILEDGSPYAQPGKLLFSDLTVDPTSGQITLRAEVPNPNGLLLPGMYVRVRLAQAALPEGILLPQQAVTRSETGDTVLVVGADNKPQKRTVKVGSAQGQSWLVTDGLQPGEKVIVDGFQKMMVPGAPVNPVPWQPAAASAPAGASTPASAASR
ncbi:efflux RND transporter periplasmic adaptor subunit [Rhizobacter sp. J219]|uniref:efflux RND transporter periplasmic adaptor subunit n=1 Tax=Rhizobacter sp. J219 TaxID=2898430 RepID=UPI002151FB11|nr:efflux RND transporter periplasmic adaptor subunit [Rhizobacter sp. J219]MCR5884235.1 efflux RND transporter periplasmic adaptor subunit [Rhizobacter sp. J219]